MPIFLIEQNLFTYSRGAVFLRKYPTKNLNRDKKIAYSTAIRPSFAKIGLKKKNLPSSRTPFLKNGDSSWN